jgi:hypothetical protein
MEKKRYLKKVTNGVVFTFDATLSKRTDMIEIPQAEAEWRIGGCKGQAPTIINPAVSQSAVDIVNSMDEPRQKEVYKLLKAKFEPAPAPELIPDGDPESQIPAPPEAPQILEPGKDEDLEKKADSIDKPVDEMTKAELQVYAQIVHTTNLDPDTMKKEPMLEAVKELDVKKAKRDAAQAAA